jgi:NAD(P)-dependent dehydrogenase (short-subunit alcohol dehydrogenase family)
MKELSGKIAVVTGGASGIGRELVRQLFAEGCSVAFCDLSEDAMTETRRLCESQRTSPGSRLTAHLVDVGDELQVLRFRDEVADQHQTDCIHLLFNNAGIIGGGSFLRSSREEWDRTFNICWNGVYYNTRAFLSMLLNAEAGHVVNMSSVVGVWAAAGARVPHTAYAAAKFAVKGFSEALVVDFRENAAHLKCSVVMPGHIGTAIVTNTRRVLRDGRAADLAGKRADLEARGYNVAAMTDSEIEAITDKREEDYVRLAPMSGAKAAATIIAGVKEGTWRILIGEDAKLLDKCVRGNPDQAYEIDFYNNFLRHMKSPARAKERAAAPKRRWWRLLR